jgi:hypothetical protein
MFEKNRIKRFIDFSINENEDNYDDSLLDQYEEELYDITSEFDTTNESSDSDMKQPSKLMDTIMRKFDGLGVDTNRIYDLTKKYIRLGLATSVIMGSLSSCASELASRKMDGSSAHYGKTFKRGTPIPRNQMDC